jgi:hypothetical protein
MSKSRATFIFSNPFYIGLFKYGGERHEGKYEPIISKKLFDEAQEMLKLVVNPSVNQKMNLNLSVVSFPVLHAE